MKKIYGIAATRQIIKKHPDTKIIIITQSNDNELYVVAINAGAVNFFNKNDITVVSGFIKSELSGLI